MEISTETRRRAYTTWLRTGHWPTIRSVDGVELKFNPWHDPDDGRFTFGPGGLAGARGTRFTPDAKRRPAPYATRVIREITSRSAVANQSRGPVGEPPMAGRGSNSRAFEDPMTLEHVFPGLRGTPGGTILAAANNLLDITGPADAAAGAILDNHIRNVIAEIKTIDPR
ncbi:hypothetical protein M9979_04265 [Sphingomonas sp. RP10(2022)]|uniref:Uncharacterized protein n=1 Tax=Sphingomonas liriopis TaxID=2949094 RepID=A0A9X2HWJ0_9SPHN|nr:hypothetical protein [Sphingomonas liriopis]MCP3734090.1 hypothetical protein [Sphingomonas liriopis]